MLLAEHRLERCLAAADRAVAIEAGSIAFDGPPRDFLVWAQEHDPALETPGSRLFSLAGLAPLPVGVRDARKLLASVELPLGRVAAVPGGSRTARPAPPPGTAARSRPPRRHRHPLEGANCRDAQRPSRREICGSSWSATTRGMRC